MKKICKLYQPMGVMPVMRQPKRTKYCSEDVLNGKGKLFFFCINFFSKVSLIFQSGSMEKVRKILAQTSNI